MPRNQQRTSVFRGRYRNNKVCASPTGFANPCTLDILRQKFLGVDSSVGIMGYRSSVVGSWNLQTVPNDLWASGHQTQLRTTNLEQILKRYIWGPGVRAQQVQSPVFDSQHHKRHSAPHLSSQHLRTEGWKVKGSRSSSTAQWVQNYQGPQETLLVWLGFFFKQLIFNR